MKLYCGVDLHSNNNYTVVQDEQDRVMYRKRLSNVLSVVLAELRPFQAGLEGWWWNRPTTGTGWWTD